MFPDSIDKAKRCQWWKGGHCWHYVETIYKQHVCKVTGTPYGSGFKDAFTVRKCCLCNTTKEEVNDNY